MRARKSLYSLIFLVLYSDCCLFSGSIYNPNFYATLDVLMFPVASEGKFKSLKSSIIAEQGFKHCVGG